MSLNGKEQRRLRVVTELLGGVLTMEEAKKELRLSERQVRRLMAAVRKEPVAGVVHGNHGRTPAHALTKEDKDQIVRWGLGEYRALNWSHLRDALEDRQGLNVSRSTVRRVLLAAGAETPGKQRRPKQHRDRRERRRRVGEMSQTDASPHRWFGPDGPEVSLVAFVDDATSTILGAIFREHEDALGYLLALRQVVERHGCPRLVYHDKHTIFGPPEGRETVHDQLEGKGRIGQIEGILEELGCVSVAAGSPQAKGRVERSWRTEHDRFVQEFALDGIHDIDAANAALPALIAQYNRRFGKAPADPNPAYLAAPDRPLDQIFCFAYRRRVKNDNTVHLGGRVMAIPADATHRTFAGLWVDVQERPDGTIAVLHGDEVIATVPPELGAPEPPIRSGGRPRHPRSTYPDDHIPTVQLTAAPTLDPPPPAQSSDQDPSPATTPPRKRPANRVPGVNWHTGKLPEAHLRPTTADVSS